MIPKISRKRKPNGELFEMAPHNIATPTEEMIVEQPQDIDHKKEIIFVFSTGAKSA